MKKTGPLGYQTLKHARLGLIEIRDTRHLPTKTSSEFFNYLPWGNRITYATTGSKVIQFQSVQWFNTLRPRQNGRHFADDHLKRIFLNETLRIAINISLKFVPKGQINNISPLDQIMAWRRPGDKPLSEPMMVRLPTHICVFRPRRVN